MHELTPDIVRGLLDYNKSSGSFTWKVSPSSGTPAGRFAGSKSTSTGYQGIQILGKRYQAHRIAVLWVTGENPSGDVDHINGIKSDNRWENLRCVSRTVNSQNIRSARSSNSTGLLGASKEGGRFRASIRHNGRLEFIGTFNTANEAHLAYLDRKREVHEGCTI